MKHDCINYILLIVAIMSSCFLIAAKPSKTALERSFSSKPIALPLENIIDGNTFVSGGMTVRIWGIISPPETHSHYFAAKYYLETILESAPFECHFIKKEDKILVMRCASQGEDIASSLLKTGMVWAAKDTSILYLENQRYAKTHSFGIWSATK
jgi:endonuclease YncB( thermonuclease family)